MTVYEKIKNKKKEKELWINDINIIQTDITINKN